MDADSEARRAARLVGMVDLTDLDDEHRADDIDDLCDRAARYRTAAVCVWPEFVARCADRLAGTGVPVATVVNFPAGDGAVDVVVAETDAALAAGADEIDVVLPYRAFVAGDVDVVAGVLDAVRASVGQHTLKVIIESGELPADRVADAARVSIAHGADFVKTSTGKTRTGATVEAVDAIAAVVADHLTNSGRAVGIKASGGIRTLADATTYVDTVEHHLGAGWARPATFRFGASALLSDLVARIER